MTLTHKYTTVNIKSHTKKEYKGLNTLQHHIDCNDTDTLLNTMP